MRDARIAELEADIAARSAERRQQAAEIELRSVERRQLVEHLALKSAQRKLDVAERQSMQDAQYSTARGGREHG